MVRHETTGSAGVRGTESRASMVGPGGSHWEGRQGGMCGGDSCGHGVMYLCAGKDSLTNECDATSQRLSCRLHVLGARPHRVPDASQVLVRVAVRTRTAPRADRRSRALDAHVLASLPI